MSDLPVEINYGKVVGKYILAVADSEDANNLPDAIPATGTIMFTPVQHIIKTAIPVATVITRSLTFSLLAGDLVDLQNNHGVWLIAGVYRVSYSIAGASLNPHDIEVLIAHTDLNPLDLTTALPPGGPVLSASQYAELSSRIDVIADAVTSVNIDDIVTISEADWTALGPGRPSGRFYLITS